MPPYYTLGRSGLRVHPLCLGTMTFGTEWGWGADQSAARALFDRYVEAGGNFFDTADLYTQGTSERWLGQFVRERRLRDKAVIATKFTYNGSPDDPNAGGNGRKHIRAAVEGSLERLGTDYIDLYLLHTWDCLTPAEEVLSTLDDLVRAGKVRYIGLSDVPAWYASRMQTLAEQLGRERLCCLQLEYSLVERSIEDEFVPLGLQHGLGIVAWSPLGMGLLSGKYKGQRPTGGRLEALEGNTNPVFQKWTPKNLEIVAELERVALELGRPMAQVALAWVLGRPGVGSVILGATKLAQLDDNLAALDCHLTPAQRARLDQISAPPPRFPYTFFTNQHQTAIHGSGQVADKPPHYAPPRRFTPPT